VTLVRHPANPNAEGRTARRPDAPADREQNVCARRARNDRSSSRAAWVTRECDTGQPITPQGVLSEIRHQWLSAFPTSRPCAMVESSRPT